MTDCALCLHHDACQAWVKHGKTLYNDFEYSTENCPYFKNKDNFEKVVRCMDCDFYDSCIKQCYATGLIRYADDFCSYGERRNKYVQQIQEERT